MGSLTRITWNEDLEAAAKKQAYEAGLPLSQWLGGLVAKTLGVAYVAREQVQARIDPKLCPSGCGHPLTSHITCGKGSTNLKCTFGSCSCRIIGGAKETAK